MSADLYWEITRNYSSYVVKRGSASGQVVFSKEPLNLKNKHSKKYSGLVTEKAIGVQPSEKGLTVITKTDNAKNGSKPAKLYHQANISKKSNRKVYSAIVSSTAKKYYRPDLREDAVARASAILATHGPKKAIPDNKPRGVKAKAGAATKAADEA